MRFPRDYTRRRQRRGECYGGFRTYAKGTAPQMILAAIQAAMTASVGGVFALRDVQRNVRQPLLGMGRTITSAGQGCVTIRSTTNNASGTYRSRPGLTGVSIFDLTLDRTVTAISGARA